VHDPAFELLPKVGRGRLDETERRIFEMFLRELPGYTSDLPTQQWEFLALGQHHGLPTRLLDWTENPLVAAFFASDGAYDREGVIYAMKNPFVAKGFGANPFEITQVLRYRPRHISARTRAQQGLFSVHPHPATPLRVGKEGGIHVQEIRIATNYKEDLAWDLARFGVRRAMLFPDIDGLAAHIRWMYETFEPSKARLDMRGIAQPDLLS
jgi:hypothetical protein